MDYLSPDDFKNLLIRMANLTLQDTLVWRVHEYEPGTYTASAEPFSFEIESVDKDGAPPFRLTIYKGKEVIESIEQTDGDVPVEDARLLSQLYSQIKQQFLGSKNLVKDLFDALDAIPPF